MNGVIYYGVNCESDRLLNEILREMYIRVSYTSFKLMQIIEDEKEEA